MPPSPNSTMTAPVAAAAETMPLAVPNRDRDQRVGPPTDVMPVARARSSRVSRRAWFGAIGVGAVVGIAGALVATERGSGGGPPVATVPTTTVVTTTPTTTPTTVARPPSTVAAPTTAAQPVAPTAKPKKGKGHGG
jgi:hypothetical protein